jgi:hypothetical protein
MPIADVFPFFVFSRQLAVRWLGYIKDPSIWHTTKVHLHNIVDLFMNFHSGPQGLIIVIHPGSCQFVRDFKETHSLFRQSKPEFVIHAPVQFFVQ